MAPQRVFARSEIKYIISAAERARIEEAMKPYMRPDEYGRSVICSVYYDTPDYLLIRRSLDSPVYKEKLRLRSYGVAKDSDIVYAEIKKKYDSVVYKRRAGMPISEAERYLEGGWKCGEPPDEQIRRELDFMLRRYVSLRPMAFVSCDREAYYAVDDHEFRVTFDTNIIGRDYDLSLRTGVYGMPLLNENQALMEIKAGEAFPLWMCRILSDERIYKSSFSKYGNIYTRLIKPKISLINGEKQNASKHIQWIV
ncbi:MAG: polyphosphate polymerase domain-containing protein [Clostridiales bacterium]|nr:polyphosphate polymerase domain-containing protein [Clostridiales bacterium]